MPTETAPTQHSGRAPASSPRASGAPAQVAHIRDLSVRFPRNTHAALTGCNLDIGSDESVLLLGTSGSGKSTVLRALAGVIPHTIDAHLTGDVMVGPPRERAGAARTPAVVDIAQHLAYVQQNPLDQLCMPTVRDELAFGLENKRVPRAQMAEAIERTLALVGAEHLADRATGSLSGGEGQRIAIAGALVREPALLLLDEPTAMLDPASTRQIGRLLEHLRSRTTGGARASILVEHRLDEIGALPDTCVILTPSGSVLAQGPTAAVLREHTSRLEQMGCWLPLGLRLTALAAGAGQEPAPTTEAALARLAQRVLPASRAHAAAPQSSATDAAETVLEARNLHVRADGRTLLADANLRLKRGRMTAVVGRNGSGKSTLLRTLAGLTDASGTLDCAGVGLVFQHPEHQFLTRSVRSEIAYGAARHPDLDARVTAILDDFGLAEFADQDPFRLSGGQQRRLSLATMAVGTDEVLLFDEPTFGQDRAHASAITAQLVALAAAGRAVVIVTHDLAVVAQIADDVVVLDSGRILTSGHPEQVLTDRRAMNRAGLTLPPALAWCAHNDVPMRPIAQALR